MMRSDRGKRKITRKMAMKERSGEELRVLE